MVQTVTLLNRGYRALTRAILLLVIAALPVSAMADSGFTAKQQRFADLSAFTKWASVLQRIDAQSPHAADDCKDDTCPVLRWEKLLTSLEGKPLRIQMNAINEFFNKFTYITDMDNWGTDDMWNTPYELMARGGDCEDYAIAKYVSLKRLGVSDSDMRIMIVQDMNLNGIMHAILEVKIDGTAYILDNQAQRVAAELSIKHYRPLYAINERAWWAYQ